MASICAIDNSSIHKITSGQVVIDLQTAVKELVENSLDAGATNIEVKFKEYGLKSVEVVDNGSGIAEDDYDSIALNHHTSKLTSLSSLTTLTSFGFRGEALSSLCALSESVVVTTATDSDGQKGVGVKLEMGKRGDVMKKSVVARQRGTTTSLSNLFTPLPVRRKEFERNAKREFGKAMGLLTAYALVPCACSSKGDTEHAQAKGVRLTLTNTLASGKKHVHILCAGAGSSMLATAQNVWGAKALESVTEFELSFSVEGPKMRLTASSTTTASASTKQKEINIEVRGLISKFSPGCGRTGTDRQFLYVNGRPCALGKIQKAFNEVYKSFNPNQSPFVVADFIIPGDAIDINVSPDKRTVFLHSEDKLVVRLKAALEEAFSASRSTYSVGQSSHSQAQPLKQTLLSTSSTPGGNANNSGIRVSKVHDLPEGPGTGDPDQPTGIKDAPTHRQGQDGDAVGDVDMWMGSPHLLIETPNKPESGHEVPPVPEIDIIVENGLIIAHDQPSTASGSTKVTMSPKDPGNVETEVTVPQIKAIQSSFDKDRRVSGSFGAPQNETLDTSLVPEGSKDRRSSRRSHVSNVSGSCQTATSTRRPVQMVLNTAGASWNLRHDVDDEVGPPRKKSRPSVDLEMPDSNATSGKSRHGARQSLRNRLSSFARTGSQLVSDNLEAGTDDEPGEETEAEVDELQSEDEVHKVANIPRRKRTNSAKKDCGAMDLDDNVDEAIRDIIPAMGMATDEDTDDLLAADKSRTVNSEPSEMEDLTGDTLVDISMLDGDSSVTETHSHNPAENFARPEIVRSANGENISMRFDLFKVSNTWRQLRDTSLPVSPVPELNSGPSASKPSLGPDAGISNVEDDEKAAHALSRVIDKLDFRSMEIVGQFNLGFIVARRRKAIHGEAGEMDDLFIVDQHAADEKYNFETLQQTTRIESQKLFRPQPLELTAADELLATENIEVLQQNGFEVDVDEDADSGLGHRLQLVAQPVSKGTNFDMKDLEELLHLMHDRPTGQMVRCSKARAMFAMRACRKSVMVGMPLTKGQMTSVVQHMGTMDQPWNCPHGRPTMRHLSDITVVGRGTPKEIDWAVFTLVQ